MEKSDLPVQFRDLYMDQTWTNISAVFSGTYSLKLKCSMQGFGPFIYMYDPKNATNIKGMMFIPNHGIIGEKGKVLNLQSIYIQSNQLKLKFNKEAELQSFISYYKKCMEMVSGFVQNFDVSTFTISAMMEEVTSEKDKVHFDKVMTTLQIVNNIHKLQAIKINMTTAKAPFSIDIDRNAFASPVSVKVGKEMIWRAFSITNNPTAPPHLFTCSTLTDMMQWTLSIYTISHAKPKAKPKPQQTKVIHHPKESEATNEPLAKKDNQDQKNQETHKPENNYDKNNIKSEETKITAVKTIITTQTVKHMIRPATISVIKEPLKPSTFEVELEPPDEKSINNKPKEKKPKVNRYRSYQRQSGKNESPKKEVYSENSLPPEVQRASKREKPLSEQRDAIMEEVNSFYKATPFEPISASKRREEFTQKPRILDQKSISETLSSIIESIDSQAPNTEQYDTESLEDMIARVSQPEDQNLIDLSQIFEFDRLNIKYSEEFGLATEASCPFVGAVSQSVQELFSCGTTSHGDGPMADRLSFLIAALLLNGLRASDELAPALYNLSCRIPELNNVMEEAGNAKTAYEQASLVATILLRDNLLGIVLRTIMRIDDWAEKYYKESAMLRHDSALGSLSILLEPVTNTHSFDIEARSDIVQRASEDDRLRLVETPAYYFMELDDLATETAACLTRQLGVGLRKKGGLFGISVGGPDPFAFIEAAATKGEIMMEGDAAFDSFVAQTKRIAALSFVEVTRTAPRLTLWVDAGMKEGVLPQWLLILYGQKETVREFYDEDSIFADPYRTHYLISAIQKLTASQQQ